jgi:predicted dehydrogenase
MYPALRLLNSFGRLLGEVDVDAIAVGDYYSRRGAIVIEALRRGKHVLSDKPVCTSLTELEEIEALLRTTKLSLGCQFTLRGSGVLRRARRAIAEGKIGPVHALAFKGQHPLNYGTRAGWYFEPGQQGGTINDIAIHAIDLIPWLTG